MSDYTWLAQVKADAQIKETTDDALLSTKISQASRIIDRLVTGREDVSDFFKSETVIDEILVGPNATVDADGYLKFWPHKPIINAFTSIAYRSTPLQSWNTIDPNSAMVMNGHYIQSWNTFTRSNIQVKTTYTGGLGVLSVDGAGALLSNTLPMDLVELATLLTIRLYREAMTGMSDSIGLADMGSTVYTKAFPARFSDFINKFARVTPW